jgi:phosphinothricin acetyltransferase
MDKTSSLKTIHVRPVSLADADACLAIYAPYVRSSHISFEYEVPTADVYRARIQKTTEQYPWFVAESDGEIIGFAYAGKFRERAAYGWALESSIYVSESHQGALSSAAKILYETLFTALRKLGTKQVLGVISLPNDKSVRFHEKMGFQTVGTFPSVGFKFDQWWDVLFMTKFLENLPFSPPVIK